MTNELMYILNDNTQNYPNCFRNKRISCKRSCQPLKKYGSPTHLRFLQVQERFKTILGKGTSCNLSNALQLKKILKFKEESRLPSSVPRGLLGRCFKYISSISYRIVALIIVLFYLLLIQITPRPTSKASLYLNNKYVC